MPLSGCLGGSGLFLTLRDSENVSISDNRLFMLGTLGVGMKPRPLERTCSDVRSREWLLKLIMYLLLILLDVEVGAVRSPPLGGAESPVVGISCWSVCVRLRREWGKSCW